MQKPYQAISIFYFTNKVALNYVQYRLFKVGLRKSVKN
jgi:hypothetical protein